MKNRILQKNISKKKNSRSLNYLKALPNKTLVTLSKLAKSFLLPISLLPIAGIFIGVGAAITTQVAKGFGGDPTLYQTNGF